MVFSAVLGLAGAGIGAAASMSAANSSAAAANYQTAVQDAHQRRQLAFDSAKFAAGQDQLAFEREQIERQNEINAQNRRMAQEQAEFERGLLQDRIGRMDQERAFDMNRLTALDKANAQQRAFEIEQYLQNRNLRAEEREYALQELQKARAMARGERQQEMSRFEQYLDRLEAERQFDVGQQLRANRVAEGERAYARDLLREDQNRAASERAYAIAQLEREQGLAAEERAFDINELRQNQIQAELERQFQIDEYRAAQDQLAREQGIQLDARDEVMGQAQSMQDAIMQTMRQMGAVPQHDAMTPQDVGAIMDEYTRMHMGDAERAAELVASQNEANLMRAGVDASTTGNVQRQNITRGIIDEFENARARARDDALAYITGIQGMQGRDQEMGFGARDRALSEVTGSYANPLQYMANLPGFNSAAIQPTGVGSAVYDRQVASAQGAQGPLAVGSGIVNRQLPSAMAPQYNLTSSAARLGRLTSVADQQGPLQVGSAVFQPSVSSLGMSTGFRPQSAAGIPMSTSSPVLNTQVMSPSGGVGLMSQAGNASGAAAGRAASAAAAARKRAGQAAGTAGRYFQDFADGLGGLLNETGATDWANDQISSWFNSNSSTPSYVGGSGPSQSWGDLQRKTKGYAGGVGF